MTEGICYLSLLFLILHVRIVLGGDCPVPTPPQNGYLSDEYKGGDDYIEYACYEGYKLNGIAENFCLGPPDARYWSSTSIPTCEATPCPDPSTIANKEYVDLSDGLNYGSVAKVTCNPAFNRDPDISRSTCQAKDSSWDPPLPQCIVPSCLIPHGKNLVVFIEPYYRRFMNNTRVEVSAYAEFSCENNELFKFEGVREAECQGSNEWDRPIPTCTEIQCSLPAAVPGRDFTISDNSARAGNKIVAQGTITFSCATNFEPVGGSNSLTCNTDGELIGTALSCEEKRCQVPREDGGLEVGGGIPGRTVSVGTVLTFSCLPGYKSSGGAAEATCLGTKKLSAQPPECIESPVPPPGPPLGPWTIVAIVLGALLGVVLLIFVGIMLWNNCTKSGVIYTEMELHIYNDGYWNKSMLEYQCCMVRCCCCSDNQQCLLLGLFSPSTLPAALKDDPALKAAFIRIVAGDGSRKGCTWLGFMEHQGEICSVRVDTLSSVDSLMTSVPRTFLYRHTRAVLHQHEASSAGSPSSSSEDLSLHPEAVHSHAQRVFEQTEQGGREGVAKEVPHSKALETWATDYSRSNCLSWYLNHWREPEGGAGGKSAQVV